MEDAENDKEYRQGIRKGSKPRKRKAAKHSEEDTQQDYFEERKRLKEEKQMESFNILAKCAAKEFKQLIRKSPEKENKDSEGNSSETENDLFDLEFPCTVKGNKKMYRCTFSGCSKEFPSLSRMRRHYIIHTGAKPFKCLSPKCHKSFSRRDNMIQHYKGHCSHGNRQQLPRI